VIAPHLILPDLPVTRAAGECCLRAQQSTFNGAKFFIVVRRLSTIKDAERFGGQMLSDGSPAPNCRQCPISAGQLGLVTSGSGINQELAYKRKRSPMTRVMLPHSFDPDLHSKFRADGLKVRIGFLSIRDRLRRSISTLNALAILHRFGVFA
jgi:hypothetical protein